MEFLWDDQVLIIVRDESDCFSYRLLSLAPFFLSLLFLSSQDTTVLGLGRGLSSFGKAKQEPGWGLGICKARNVPTSISSKKGKSIQTWDQTSIKKTNLSVAFFEQISIETYCGSQFVYIFWPNLFSVRKSWLLIISQDCYDDQMRGYKYYL